MNPPSIFDKLRKSWDETMMNIAFANNTNPGTEGDLDFVTQFFHFIFN